jgi:hypothetical protein
MLCQWIIKIFLEIYSANGDSLKPVTEVIVFGKRCWFALNDMAKAVQRHWVWTGLVVHATHDIYLEGKLHLQKF